MTDDESKARMNLTAIKKVDPYANEIVDTSSHVAFYTFNSDKNEWEKTDVEGAFFIYSRNAVPKHSIFINNRLNTMSFVEPITSEMELQSQPPFLLYRNERSRIRGFWFYNSEECERISKLVAKIVPANLQEEFVVQKQKAAAVAIKETHNAGSAVKAGTSGNGSMDIFKMLSKAQQDYNESQQKIQESTDNNVMKFFAAAKGPVQPTMGILPNTLCVEQLEKQQRNRSPIDAAILKSSTATTTPSTTTAIAVEKTQKLSQCLLNMQQLNTSLGDNNNSGDLMHKYVPNASLSNFINAATANLNAKKQMATTAKNTAASDLKKSLLQSISQDTPLILPNRLNVIAANKPALMLPTMFEKTSNDVPITTTALTSSTTTTTLPAFNANKLSNNSLLSIKTDQQQLTLNPTQLVQAFSYLLQNDEEFVLKLHEAYIKTVSKTLLQNYQ